MNKSLQSSLMLAPLLGATDAWMTALGLWLMFMVVITAFGGGMDLLRPRLVPGARLVAAILLAAALTSCAELAAQAWSLQWHRQAGPYAGLIALQCIVLERTGFFQRAWRDRLRLCGLLGLLMVSLGLLREWLGNSGLHFATLVPGGLILLGSLMAARQAWFRSPSLIDRPEETSRR